MQQMDTERIKQDLREEAVQIAGRVADLMEKARAEGLERLPERDELQQRLTEESEELYQKASAWAQTLGGALAERLGYVRPEKRRARTFFGILLAVGLGAALMYLFDPEKGAERRARLMGKAQEVVPSQADGKKDNASLSTPQYQS